MVCRTGVWFLLIMACTVCFDAAWADTIVLDNGRSYKGKITVETDTYVVIVTASGKKRFRIGRVKKIIRDADAGRGTETAMLNGGWFASVSEFSSQPNARQELANAEALYALKKYDQIIPRLQPLLDTNIDEDVAWDIKWVIVEAHERLAQFDEADKILDDIKANGRELDKIRATAHLDIFEQNPNAVLRRVGDRHARDFLKREEKLRGKKPNALASLDLMRAALEEYCYQILTDGDVSLKAVRESMEHDYTVAAIKEMPARAGKVAKYLPFAEDLEKVEESLRHVNAILPGYAMSYQTDLLQSEARHVYAVLRQLFGEVAGQYPAFTPPADEFGRLTKEGREQWRERCEDFAEALRPLLLIAKHLEAKVSKYPDRLRYLNLQYHNIVLQLEEVRAATLRKKERTRV